MLYRGLLMPTLHIAWRQPRAQMTNFFFFLGPFFFPPGGPQKKIYIFFFSGWGEGGRKRGSPHISEICQGRLEQASGTRLPKQKSQHHLNC